MEALETRTLLSESATAQISLASTSSSGGATTYHYDMTVHDTGTTPIGTFWFAWTPGNDFLPSAPVSTQNPAGWTNTITSNNVPTDGFAIEWVASSNLIAPGSSLTGFDFASADSPAQLAANSPTHTTTPTTTSFVYSGAPFSDSGFQFVATPPATTAASTTTLTSTSSNPTAGASVTFTATVAPSSGSGTDPTGTVTFASNGTTIGTSPVGAGGVATLSTSALAAGTDQIVASYGGDSNYSSSTSTPLTETVSPPTNAPATTTTLTSSSPAAAPGTSLTLTATVAPTAGSGTPTGTVNFLSNGTSIGSVTLANGVATLTTASLATGSDSITATYNGDANFAASTSAAVVETISAPAAIVPSIAKSTLPAALVTGSAARGRVSVGVVNQSANLVKGKATFEIFATATGSVNASAVALGRAIKSLSLKAGKRLTFSIPLSVAGSALAAGTYSLIVQATDPSGTVSVSAPGESLTVAAAFIALTETVNKSTIPASTTGASKSHASVTMTIVNNGNVATTGTTTISLFATASGMVDAAATQIATLAKGLRIKPGKSAKVVVQVKQIPSIAVGTYTVVAQVTDPNRQMTSATVGSLTITG